MKKIGIIIIFVFIMTTVLFCALILYINQFRKTITGIGSDGFREYDCQVAFIESNNPKIDKIVTMILPPDILAYKLIGRNETTIEGNIAKEAVNSFKTLNKYSSNVVGITQSGTLGNNGSVLIYSEKKILGYAIFKNNRLTTIPAINP